VGGLIGSALSDDSQSLDARYDSENSATSTVGTLGAINYIVGALSEMPGRKSIVLFSDGLQVSEAGVGSHAHRLNAQAADDALDTNADVQRALRS